MDVLVQSGALTLLFFVYIEEDLLSILENSGII